MKSWSTSNGYEIIQVLSGRSNAFIISRQGKFVLVDTGRIKKWDELSYEIEEYAYSNVFSALILTHTHFDHAENAGSIQNKYHVPVIVNQKEEDSFAGGGYPLPQGTLPITKLATDLFAEKLQKRLLYDFGKPDISVNEKVDLDCIGFEKVYILHTPGHTVGSQSVIIDDEIAIVGDAMFGVYPWSIFPPFADDIQLLVSSWKKLLETNCRVFIPSHGSENSRSFVEKQYKKYTADIK